MSDFNYKTQELRVLLKEFNTAIRAMHDDEVLKEATEEVALKIRETGGYKKAFTRSGFRKNITPDCIVIGKSPSGRFIYALLPRYYGSPFLIKTDSGPLFEIEEGTPEHQEHLDKVKEMERLSREIRDFEKGKQIA